MDDIDTSYDDMLRRKRRESVGGATKTSAVSGALTGGALGALAKAWGGSRNWRDILKAALAGGGVYGGVAGGATAIGSGVMGAPNEDDPTGYTRRGTFGGLVGGGLLGAGLGALAAKGHVKVPDNLLGDLFKRAIAKGGKDAWKYGAGIGGAAGGATGAYIGADEGMQADVYTQEMAKRRREALAEALAL